LVLTGTGLIFFLIAAVVVCYGFRMRKTLIIYQCFRWFRARFILSQGLASFMHCPDSKVLEVHKKLEWDRTRSAGQRAIPYHITSCKKINSKTMGSWLGGQLLLRD